VGFAWANTVLGFFVNRYNCKASWSCIDAALFSASAFNFGAHLIYKQQILHLNDV